MSQNIFKKRDVEKKYDIGFSGALHDNKHYPKGSFPTENLRRSIGEILTSLKDNNIFWNGSDSIQPRIKNYNEYATVINQAKMWVSTHSAYRDIVPRNFEVCGSETLLFVEKIPPEYSHIFIDGRNCIEFENDLSNFLEKFNYYLNNEQEYKRIVEQGYIDAHEKHTWKHRAEELLNMVREFKS